MKIATRTASDGHAVLAGWQDLSIEHIGGVGHHAVLGVAGFYAVGGVVRSPESRD